MKLLVINNLASGPGDGAIFDFLRAFSDHGDEATIRSFRGQSDLTELLEDAEDYDLVVASGGDGTVASVSYLMSNRNVPVFPFPAGTANLLATNLEYPTEAHALAATAKRCKTLGFDLGELETSGGTFGFGIIAGCGYDAIIMRNAAQLKDKLGPTAYLASILANPIPGTARFKLELDGETVESEGLGILIVNFSKLQFELPLLHENAPRDGKFEIVVLKGKTAFELIPPLMGALFDMASGDFPDRSKTFEVYRASSVRIESDPPMEVQYDGEATGIMTPFRATIMPEALRFVVSPESEKLFSDERILADA